MTGYGVSVLTVAEISRGPGASVLFVLSRKRYYRISRIPVHVAVHLFSGYRGLRLYICLACERTTGTGRPDTDGEPVGLLGVRELGKATGMPSPHRVD